MQLSNFIVLTILSFPWLSWTSLAACNLHLINSVGHKENEEKKAAKHPAVALPNTDKSSDF